MKWGVHKTSFDLPDDVKDALERAAKGRGCVVGRPFACRATDELHRVS
jgi:hypothetical protein